VPILGHYTAKSGVGDISNRSSAKSGVENELKRSSTKSGVENELKQNLTKSGFENELKHRITKSGVDRDEHGACALQDDWQELPNACIRIHARPRVNLFTPMRVAGSPPAKALANSRITTGMYINSKEMFQVRDSWHARATAHRALDEPWVGFTSFLRFGSESMLSNGPENACLRQPNLSHEGASIAGASSAGGSGNTALTVPFATTTAAKVSCCDTSSQLLRTNLCARNCSEGLSTPPAFGSSRSFATPRLFG
jgi:hypothetical protein